jgi:hypothetical protein
MDNLHIAKTEKTPLIEFTNKGELRIEGRSVPENPIAFYERPITWLKNFIANKPKEINIHVCLYHFNTASSKILLDMLKLIEPLKTRGSAINLYWYHEEDNPNMLDSGEDYASILKYPFHFVKLPEQQFN